MVVKSTFLIEVIKPPFYYFLFAENCFIYAQKDDVDPANSNSTLYALADESMCPRNREEAVARGRTCLRKCNSDSDCISSRKKCLCDGLCGWSCVRPGNHHTKHLKSSPNLTLPFFDRPEL